MDPSVLKVKSAIPQCSSVSFLHRFNLVHAKIVWPETQLEYEDYRFIRRRWMSMKGKCMQSPSWKELCDATLHYLQNNVFAEPDRSAHLYFTPFCPLDPKLSVNIHSETHTAKESLWEHSIVKSNFKVVKNTVNNVELPRRRETYGYGSPDHRCTKGKTKKKTTKKKELCIFSRLLKEK